jgi:hypothetical protein
MAMNTIAVAWLVFAIVLFLVSVLYACYWYVHPTWDAGEIGADDK